MAKNTKLELTWAGKDAQISPEPRILLEQKDKNYGDQDTENMLIHGDNLLALKSLEDEFTGKIKCIYIDPPYNTGNAFEHYNDGYEHSIWLSLMRDRLEILKDLLAEDGVIFVQIDDNEHSYLKMMMDEIFGRNNFVADIIWRKKSGGGQTSEHFVIEHEYILVFKKNNWAIIDETEDYKVEDFSKIINGKKAKLMKLEKWGNSARREDRPSLYYPIKDPNGNDFYPKAPDGNDGRWRKKPENLDNKHIHWEKRNEEWKPYEVIYFDELDKKTIKTRSIWLDYGNNTEAANEIKALFGSKDFETPKPEGLIKQILTIATEEDDIVLDSFLGSATTAAVAHKMGRRWIGIELGDHAYTHCIPRLQKVIDGTDQGGISKAVGWTGGGGFKFYELASSLIVKDARGFDVISKEYNGDMLTEAMCKIMGFKYRPDKEIFWKQGQGTEKNWLFTTTMTLTEDYLEEIHEELGDESLLICCGGFTGNKNAFKNITIKKIPKSILEKCEWNKPGYPLPVKEDFTAKDFEFEGE